MAYVNREFWLFSWLDESWSRPAFFCSRIFQSVLFLFCSWKSEQKICSVPVPKFFCLFCSCSVLKIWNRTGTEQEQIKQNSQNLFLICSNRIFAFKILLKYFEIIHNLTKSLSSILKIEILNFYQKNFNYQKLKIEILNFYF